MSLSCSTTVQVLKMSVNVCVQRQNVKTIVIVIQTKTQCITKEQVHPSAWHNKEISAILLLQDEVNHLLYRWERAKRGRHKNSIKTSRSWLSNSKRRSSYFHSLWMLMGKQAESRKGTLLSRKQFQIISKHENSGTLHLDKCLALTIGWVIDVGYQSVKWLTWCFSFHLWTHPRNTNVKMSQLLITIPSCWLKQCSLSLSEWGATSEHFHGDGWPWWAKDEWQWLDPARQTTPALNSFLILLKLKQKSNSSLPTCRSWIRFSYLC